MQELHEADELARLRRENQLLREGRLELVQELNRIIALGDFAMRCATAGEPSEVLERALDLVGSVLGMEQRTAFGLSGDRVDVRAFSRRAPESRLTAGDTSRAISPNVAAYLRSLPVATIVRCDEEGAGRLEGLLDVLFPHAAPHGTALVIPLKPLPGETIGAIVACNRSGPASDRTFGPKENDATFLVLLSNHVDRALQSALLVADLRARGEELAESTRRFRENLAHLKGTEEELVKARSFQSLARLAGDVARDFSDLLADIKHHVGRLDQDLPARSSGRDDVAAIGAAVDRATRITRQLLELGAPSAEPRDEQR
ncbi:MAG: hypothetical protein HOW73_06285 [Polyangiaceae bacterium]|nr:hypothetical protein [Polyangiaceae bacterium]